MAKVVYHLTMDVQQLLMWPADRLKRALKDESGKAVPADEARKWLNEYLAEGNRELPMGEPCSCFDPKQGCTGHKTDS